MLYYMNYAHTQELSFNFDALSIIEWIILEPSSVGWALSPSLCSCSTTRLRTSNVLPPGYVFKINGIICGKWRAPKSARFYSLIALKLKYLLIMGWKPLKTQNYIQLVYRAILSFTLAILISVVAHISSQ